MTPFTLAIQYPSFGPNHPARVEAIARRTPYSGARIVAMEMYRRDSDYAWEPVTREPVGYERRVVMDGDSASGRLKRRELRRAVWRALDEIRPSVLVVNGWGHRESRRSLEWARRRRCPTVLLSDSRIEDAPRVWWKEAAKRWIVRNCRSAFVAGSPQARYAEALGVPRERIFHPGACAVDNDFWRERSAEARRDAPRLRAELALPERYFLCVARLIEKKNVPFLARAFGEYRRLAGERAWSLVICGSGPEEGRVREAMAALPPGAAILRPFQQAGDLAIHYGLASALVIPSWRYEQWGLVANEAMACGLPILASRACGCAEDLARDGENGFAFDPRDEPALARLLLEISSDDARLEKMGARSAEIIDGHSCDAAAQSLWRAVEAALHA